MAFVLLANKVIQETASLTYVVLCSELYQKIEHNPKKKIMKLCNCKIFDLSTIKFTKRCMFKNFTPLEVNMRTITRWLKCCLWEIAFAHSVYMNSFQDCSLDGVTTRPGYIVILVLKRLSHLFLSLPML